MDAYRSLEFGYLLSFVLADVLVYRRSAYIPRTQRESAYPHAPSPSFCKQASGQRQHRVNTRGPETYPKPLDSATLPSVRPMVYRRAGAAKARGSVRNAATREIMVVVVVIVQVADSSRRRRQRRSRP